MRSSESSRAAGRAIVESFASNNLASHRLWPRLDTANKPISAVTAGREPIRAPLQGAFWPRLYPGLKPWAIMLRHFMASIVRCPSSLHTPSLHVAGFEDEEEDEAPREGKALPWCHLVSRLTWAESPILEFDHVCDTGSDR
jgi:hypothetical protein